LKRLLQDWLSCPRCRGAMSLVDAHDVDGEVESGRLQCDACEAHYPIVRYIPRFVSQDNYASSFGFQWNRFRQTQLDSYTGTSISRDRFLRQTGWSPAALSGAAVLDAGCGAGRFTEVALSMGAQVFAFDYSVAVDACRENFASHPNLHLLQADIYALPLQYERFDFVYCLGVLQNTPDPQKACLALPPHLKPGGQLAVDVYPRRWVDLLHPKYCLRPITKRVPCTSLFQALEWGVPKLLRLSQASRHVPAVGPLLRRLVPVANYEGIYPLNERQQYEWAVLDTFDWLSPSYDKPQAAHTLRSWLEESDLEEVYVARLGHLVGRGRKSKRWA
jgi:2-polyprenyl-3-methyl-5-hydroxy-6-metoxy-1,4-benzoquinol methylase